MTLREPTPRVLVVDDNVDAADTLASLLTLFDCSVHVAYSGIEALALGDLLSPQLVILDVMMPRMDGRQTALRMRARPWGQQACIAALTACADDLSASTAQAGMDYYLTKPVSAGMLLDILAKVRA
ncbi:response regulator [Massilia sp. UMI-21]|nr:response regulator [Massilia sp. UMI-21]